jgi:hypothetical protein
LLNAESMNRGLLRLAIAVCALLGAIHVGFTRRNYDALSPDAVWFAATGFALLFLAALNWAALLRAHPERSVRLTVVVADIVATIGGSFAVYAVQEPQAYVLVLTFAALAVTGATEDHRLARVGISTPAR